MSEWQPIETAPRDGTPILLSNGRSCVHLAWYRDSDEPYPWFLVDNFDFVTGEDCVDRIELNSAMESWATHWMPIPAAPSAAA